METFETISEEQFDQEYKPQQNHLDDNACYDGCLFETYGEELEYVLKQAPNRIWTLIEGDEGLWIVSGYHLVNRLGYFITEKSLENGTEIEVQVD